MTALATVHPFEMAGLGLAPFHCVGMHQRRLPGSGQPAGTCDYCGNGILFCFDIRSADGKRFIVGSDCVMRTGGEYGADEMTAEVRRLVAEQRRVQDAARRKAKFEALYARVRLAKAALAEHPELFADQPHPYERQANAGRKLRDYYDYCLTWGGDETRKSACKTVEAAIAAPPASTPEERNRHA